jgi:hypothetical protein
MNVSPPIGMGGGTGGPGGAGERQHRNQCYRPSDEPFQIDLDVDENGEAIAPTVLGIATPDAAPRPEPWERW